MHTIGLLAPGERLVEFHGTVVTPTAAGAPESDELNGSGCAGAMPMVRATWWRTSSPWKPRKAAALGRLALSEPYSLGPVTEREDFAGQEGAIRDLTKAVLQLGSARIQGEKRVGKTSLANAVRDPAAELSERPLCFIALESGDFNATTPEATVQRLGQMIAEQVRHTDQRLARLTVPDFSAGLSTLTEFFAGAQELCPPSSASSSSSTSSTPSPTPSSSVMADSATRSSRPSVASAASRTSRSS